MQENKTTVSRIAPIAPVQKRKRVAAYARVSSGKDAMLHSLAAQVSYYSELIQRNPAWEYAGVYADENLSGTKEARPEFQRMLRDCRDGKIDRILCKSTSRFARNTVTLLEVARELKELGISVSFEKENIDTMSGDGELMLTILASLAQEESRSVSENCKWRVRKKFEQGVPTGFRMYGYDVRNGSFTILPEESAIIQRIFHMYLDGMGSERIMRVLNAEGIPAPEGGLWNAGTIMMMLRNEKYAGNLLLQKSYVNNHVEKKQLPNRGELPQYFVAEDHAPIIDMETFDAVQAEIAGRRELHTAKAADAVKRPDMPLGDRIICGICGKKYRRKITRQGTPYAAPVWICATFNYRGKAFCASKQIPEQTLMELIAAALGETHTVDDVEHIEMHPGNRVLFVFRDGRAEEHFWKDRSRRDSWYAERRKRAAEKTRAQRQRGKENPEQ